MSVGRTKNGHGRWYRFQIRAHRFFNSLPLSEYQKTFVLTILIGVTCGVAAVLFHAYPVIDKAGALRGPFTFNDLKRALSAGDGERRVREVVSRKIVHAHPDHTLDTVILKLGRKGVSQLPVVSRKDTSRLLGIITMHDVAEALARDSEPPEEIVDEESEG